MISNNRVLQNPKMAVPVIFESCFLLLFKLHSFSNAETSWKLDTIPSVFGHDVMLKCTLPQNCCKTTQSRRWLGGNDLHLLTINGFSIDSDKYSEVFNKDNKFSLLTIHSFDIVDINVPYECSYGLSTFVKILNLTEDKFEYRPSGPRIENITLNDTNALSVNVSTDKLFPRPKCSATMNNDDISSYMTTTVIMKGLFYFAIITVAFLLTPESCPGFLSISCEVGTYLFVYEKNVTCNMNESNTDKEITNMRALVLIIIATASLLVLIATYAVYKIRGSHGNTHSFNEEEHAMNLDTLPKRRNEKRVKMK